MAATTAMSRGKCARVGSWICVAAWIAAVSSPTMAATPSTGSEIHVRKSGSTYTVTDGPFTESKEIVGGYAVLSVASREEAVSWTKRFLEAAGDGISELHELMDTQ